MMGRKSSVRQSVALESADDGLLIGRMDGAICDDQECWNEKRWKLIETNKRTFWHRTIRFFLAAHNYDPYAIFKSRKPFDCPIEFRWFGCMKPEVSDTTDRPIETSDPARSCDRFMMNHLGLLGLPTTKADRARHRYTGILRCYVSLFFIKSLIICAIQHANLKYKLLVPRGYKPPWLTLNQIEFVTRLLGNPLEVLKDTSMLLYSAPAALCVLSFVLLPLYYERYPMNIAALRFILDPAHELKRVDLNIKRKMDDIRMSLCVFAAECERMLLDVCSNNDRHRNHRQRLLPPITSEAAKKLLEFERSYSTRLESYLDEFDRRLHTFRPHLFSARYFEESSAKMSTTVSGVHLLYAFCSSVMISATEIPAYSDHCERHRQELAARNRTRPALCNPLDIYTPAELLVLTELALMLIFCYVISGLNLALFSLVSGNQKDLIKSIRRQLVRCRDLIHCDNPIQSVDNHRSGDEAVKGRLELDKSRLELLIKVMACEKELHDNARSMSELTLHAVYYAVATIVFLVIVGGQFHITESQASRSFIMIATWINVNAIAISCAHIFSRVIEFERVMWSILAAQASELIQYNRLNRPLSSNVYAQVSEGERAESSCCTFVTNLWVKFVLATSLNVERYCARPLNVKLTYEMIIELNFFVVLIYSLSRDMPDRR